MTKIAVIGAMEEEINLILSRLEKNRIKEIGNFKFHICNYKSKEIIIMKSGIGKVNSAVGTQLMITHFSPDYVINTGIAGGISKEVKVLDIILASDTMQYDVDVTKFGYKLGQIPRMEKYIFNTDNNLLKHAKASLKNGDKYKIGRIVSGDKFISKKSTKQFLDEKFGAMCADMESGSIGHVCYINDTPYIAIRCISDDADESSHINYDKFEKEAANKSAELVIDIIKKL
jgi:adenosylhomocysteine nucleosidase